MYEIVFGVIIIFRETGLPSFDYSSVLAGMHLRKAGPRIIVKLSLLVCTAMNLFSLIFTQLHNIIFASRSVFSVW